MAYKLLDAAQDRWRRIRSPELAPLVRAGATFILNLDFREVAGSVLG